ncbi:MAG: hypothetical protein JKX96_00590, partial [Acinetobacter sp.]|nr:hypothetical protein [Acinetobacter sp.]
QICLEDGNPNIATVFRWLVKYKEFSDNYARARDEQSEGYADEIVYIADNAKDPALARLQIDARKWVASKLKPKKYGDRLDLNHGGQDGNPVTTKLVVEFIDPKPK